jgi:hypothetical protein
LLRLVPEDAFNAARRTGAHHVSLSPFALCDQCRLKFLIAIEMILNRALVATCYENQRVDFGRDCFFGGTVN